MTPTIIIVGFAAGLFGKRGWWFLLIVAIGWPLLLIATDVDSGFGFFVSAAAVGVVNAVVGIALGHMTRLLTARVRLRT